MPTRSVEELRLPRRWSRLDSRLWREWCFARVLARQFRGRLIVVAAIIAAGAVAFWTLERERGRTPVEALYFTWSLIFNQAPEPLPAQPLLRMLFFLLPVAGLLVILESMVEFALVLRDRRRSEHMWCREMTRNLTDHIILVGLGRLGYRAFRLLRRLGAPVVVIERTADNQFLEAVRREGVPVFIADARRDQTLVEANVAAARSIIPATNDDLANLEIALDARRLNPRIRVVLRMFDQNLADKVRDGFDIHTAMSQAAIAAPTFAIAAISESIVGTNIVGDELVILQRWRVRRGGPLDGRSIAEVLRQLKIAVVERRDAAGATELFPPPETVLAPGDELLVQGTFERIEALPQEVLPHPRRPVATAAAT